MEENSKELCTIHRSGFKFEVLGSDSTQFIGKHVVVLLLCPEFNGEGFFEKGKIYSITAKRYDGFDPPIIRNDYKKENLQIFENNKIVRLEDDSQKREPYETK